MMTTNKASSMRDVRRERAQTARILKRVEWLHAACGAAIVQTKVRFDRTGEEPILLDKAAEHDLSMQLGGAQYGIRAALHILKAHLFDLDQRLQQMQAGHTDRQ